MANPISKTAFYTLGVRAWDAELPKPASGDSFAKVFMNEDANKIWEEFKDFKSPNASNAARHALIDNQVREGLAVAPDSLIVIIGAGFDTRAFRIKGGRWIEVDEASIIDYKESKLPASKAPNRLTRLSIDFAKEALTEKLSSFATSGLVHIIIEGVLMYLTHDERQSLIKGLQKMFPKQIVYCDLMRQSFFEKYSKKLYIKIRSLGASFADLTEQPENLFLNNGYKALSCTSIALYASENGNLPVPPFVIRYFLKALRDGYTIQRFEYSK